MMDDELPISEQYRKEKLEFQRQLNLFKNGTLLDKIKYSSVGIKSPKGKKILQQIKQLQGEQK